MIQEIKKEAREAALELIGSAALKKGAVLVVGCSSSEILGEHIGKGGSPQAGQAVYEGIMEALDGTGIRLAAQCCEHLNRALIVERETARELGLEIVSVRPRPKAGGSFATAAFEGMSDPVAAEYIKADAGLDIGGTLIGMHLRAVAVPLRLGVKAIGKASVAAARTRPKLIGGERAVY